VLTPEPGETLITSAARLFGIDTRVEDAPQLEHLAPPLHGDELRQAENPGYAYAKELQDAWGEAKFIESAFYKLWLAEYEHLQAKDTLAPVKEKGR
jgi:hypothetical protein